MNGSRRKPPQRIVVDAAVCDGHGICVLRCPERFSLDPFGFVGVDDDTPLTGRELRRARSAAAACPEGALTFVDAAATNSPAPTPKQADSSTW